MVGVQSGKADGMSQPGWCSHPTSLLFPQHCPTAAATQLAQHWSCVSSCSTKSSHWATPHCQLPNIYCTSLANHNGNLAWPKPKEKRCIYWDGSQVNYFVNKLGVLPKNGGQILIWREWVWLKLASKRNQEKHSGAKSHLIMPVLLFSALQKVKHNLPLLSTSTFLHRIPALPPLMLAGTPSCQWQCISSWTPKCFKRLKTSAMGGMPQKIDTSLCSLLLYPQQEKINVGGHLPGMRWSSLKLLLKATRKAAEDG